MCQVQPHAYTAPARRDYDRARIVKGTVRPPYCAKMSAGPPAGSRSTIVS